MITDNNYNKRYIIEPLPYVKELDDEVGIQYNDDCIEVNIKKFIVDEWVETTETVHDCVSNGDCKRCSMNDKVMYHYLVINSIKGKTVHTFERHIADQLGSVWSNWTYKKDFIPAK